MALVKCGECGREISDKAAACPGCGAPVSVTPTPPPLSQPSSSRPAVSAPLKSGGIGKLGGCLTLVVLFFVFLILMKCTDSTSPSKAVTSTEVQTPSSVAAATDPKASKEAIATWLAAVKDESLSPEQRLASANTLIARAEGTPEAYEAGKLLGAIAAEVEDKKSDGVWQYQSGTDPMSGKTTKQAAVVSDNTVEFDFPYTGAQRGRLMLRNHPKWGKDVIVSIEKGQILCHSFSGCPIGVRFDDEPMATYSGTEPADNSSDTVFIPAYSKFYTKLAKAKRVRIQMNVYQQGAVVFEFNVKGFDGNQLK